MQTTDFVALYRGQTVAGARLIAVTADPEVVEEILRTLVGDMNGAPPPEADVERSQGSVDAARV